MPVELPPQYIAIIRRNEPISGVAIQPEFGCGPLTKDDITPFAKWFEENAPQYHIEDFVPLYRRTEILAEIYEGNTR